MVFLYIVVGLLTAFVLLNTSDCGEERRRLDAVNQNLVALYGHVATLRAELTQTHGQLVDGLWERASVEVDREIERARARGRDS